jgi:hypothetical protein
MIRFRAATLAIAIACSATALSAEPTTPAELAVAAGAPPAPAGWHVLRTSWGDPDLTGTWPLEFLSTRPERAQNLGEKRYWTDEEYKKLLAAGPGFGGDYATEAKANTIGSGHWTEAGHPLKLTSLIVEPANGRYPPLTEAGKARQAKMRSSWSGTTFDSIADFNTLDRCLSRGMPTSMTPFPYNNGLRIFQAPGYVVIQLELIHETRIIPLGPRPALPDAIRTYLGESRGHWEGDTLVIETRNFNGEPPMNLVGPGGLSLPASPKESVVERLTPTGPDTIFYEVTVDDPGVFTAPFKMAFPWHRNDDYKLFEYACHEGNTIVQNYIHATSPRFAAQRAAAKAANAAGK